MCGSVSGLIDQVLFVSVDIFGEWFFGLLIRNVMFLFCLCQCLRCCVSCLELSWWFGMFNVIIQVFFGRVVIICLFLFFVVWCVLWFLLCNLGLIFISLNGSQCDSCFWYLVKFCVIQVGVCFLVVINLVFILLFLLVVGLL